MTKTLFSVELCSCVKMKPWAGEMDLLFKGTCFCRESEFDSQHPHGSSQSSITLVLGNPKPSSDLCKH